MVTNILRNRIYIGEWYQYIGKEQLLLHCPPIIEQRQFDVAQELFKQRSPARYKQEMEKAYRVFGAKVFDLETDWPLTVHINKKDGTRMFRFKYPAPAVHLYEKLTLSCGETESSVGKQLQAQKEMADHAAAMFDTENATTQKEMLIAPIRETANELFEQMLRIESQIMHDAEFNETKTQSLKACSDLAQARYEYLYQTRLLDFYRGRELTL